MIAWTMTACWMLYMAILLCSAVLASVMLYVGGRVLPGRSGQWCNRHYRLLSGAE